MSAAEACRVVALAGRRVDAPDAETARFPASQVAVVRERVRDWLSAGSTRAIVASAACGADLIALEAAVGLGIRIRVVLPFRVELFRETSVVDRPGQWGAIYDRVIARAIRNGDLVVLEEVGEGSTAYAAANEAILDEAGALTTSLGCHAEAAIVWDGRSRGEGDQTAAFARSARARGLPVSELPTGAIASHSGSRRMT